MKKAKEITKKAVQVILKRQHPKSMTAISKALGRKGSISGSLSKRIKAWFPNIDEILKKNQAINEISEVSESNEINDASEINEISESNETSETKSVEKPAKKAVAKTSSKYPRHPKNPFRVGSSYATAFDILASFKDGLHRKKLVELHAKATGKSEKKAGYDCAVLLSAKESNAGPRHRSCRDGYWVRRENSHVLMVIDE